MDHPSYLLALPLLALPWLLKVIFPQIPTLIKYSQMYLLEKVLKQQRSIKKINIRWLNLIRSAILASMIFILLGIHGNSPPLDPNASQVILLDDSFFSHANDQSDFNEQKKQAKSLILSMSPQQEVAIIGRSGHFFTWSSTADALLKLKSWQPSYQAENWNIARSQITKLHRQRRGTHLEIHLLGPSLSAKNQDFTNALTQLPEGTRLHSQLFERDDIKSTQLFASHWHEGDQTIVTGHIHPTASQYSLKFTPLHQGETLINHFSNSFTWSLPKVSGTLSLVIEDDLSIDQHHHIPAESRKGRKVYLLSPQEAPQRLQNTTHYLQKGLMEVCQKKDWSFHKLSPLKWHEAFAQAGDILILHNPPACSEQENKSLEQWLDRGGHLFIFPGPQTPPSAFDAFESLPAKILGTSQQPFQVIWPEVFQQHSPTFSKITFKDGFTFKDLHPKSEVQARRSDGSPFWISLKNSPKRGTIHLCSSPLHIAWSTATLKSDFIESLKLFLSQSSDRPFPSQLDTSETLPNVQSIKTVLGESSVTHLAPGFIEVTQKSGKSSLVAVNFSPHHLEPRLPIQAPILEKNKTATHESQQKERLDHIFAILLALLLLGEATFLFLNNSKLSKRTKA